MANFTFQTSMEEKIRENNKQSPGTFSSSKSVSTDNKILRVNNIIIHSYRSSCGMMSSELSSTMCFIAGWTKRELIDAMLETTT